MVDLRQAQKDLKAAQADLSRAESLRSSAQAILDNPKSSATQKSNARRIVDATTQNITVFKARAQNAFARAAQAAAAEAKRKAKQQAIKRAAQEKKRRREAQKAAEVKRQKEAEAKRKAEAAQKAALESKIAQEKAEQLTRIEQKKLEAGEEGQLILQQAEAAKTEPQIQQDEVFESEAIQQQVKPTFATKEEELEAKFLGPGGLKETAEARFEATRGPSVSKEFREGKPIDPESLEGRFIVVQKGSQDVVAAGNLANVQRFIAGTLRPSALEVRTPEGKLVDPGALRTFEETPEALPILPTGRFELEQFEGRFNPETGRFETGTGLVEFVPFRELGGFESPELQETVRGFEETPPSLQESLGFGVPQPPPPRKQGPRTATPTPTPTPFQESAGGILAGSRPTTTFDQSVGGILTDKQAFADEDFDVRSGIRDPTKLRTDVVGAQIPPEQRDPLSPSSLFLEGTQAIEKGLSSFVGIFTGGEKVKLPFEAPIRRGQKQPGEPDVFGPFEFKPRPPPEQPRETAITTTKVPDPVAALLLGPTDRDFSNFLGTVAKGLGIDKTSDFFSEISKGLTREQIEGKEIRRGEKIITQPPRPRSTKITPSQAKALIETRKRAGQIVSSDLIALAFPKRAAEAKAAGFQLSSEGIIFEGTRTRPAPRGPFEDSISPVGFLGFTGTSVADIRSQRLEFIEAEKERKRQQALAKKRERAEEKRKQKRKQQRKKQKRKKTPSRPKRQTAPSPPKIKRKKSKQRTKKSRPGFLFDIGEQVFGGPAGERRFF